MIVPHVLTPWSLTAAPEVLHAAYHRAIGTCPGDDVVATAIAQLQEEHGADLRAVWGWNLGNVDATAAELADPAIPIFSTVPECEGRTCSARAVHHRRAFDSADDGAAYYWASMRERFPGAFYAMGDPAAFVRELKAARYFTGDESAYTAAVVSLAAAALRRMAGG